MVMTSFILKSSAFSSIIFLQVLLFAIVTSFIKLSLLISSIFLVCRICFLVMMYSTGIWPVSFRRIVVGVALGRYGILLIASLRIVWSLAFSSLVGIQLSQAYVSMGLIMESSSCHIAFISIPLNSLFPASAMIRVVAPFIFLATSAIWSDRLPLLFPPGTCMRGLLPVLLHSVLGCFFFLSLSLPLCTCQIEYGICLRHGLLRRVFLVVFVGRGGSGIHRPSIESMMWFCCVLCFYKPVRKSFEVRSSE